MALQRHEERRVNAVFGGVARIQLDGSLKIGNRLPVANHRKLVAKIASSQISFVRLRIKRGRAGGATVSRIEFYSDLFSHCPCDLFLQSNGVTDMPVVAVSPDMHLVRGTDKLGANTHLVPIAPDTALQDVIDSQFSCDLLRAFRCTFVSHRGRACDHAELIRT